MRKAGMIVLAIIAISACESQAEKDKHTLELVQKAEAEKQAAEKAAKEKAEAEARAKREAQKQAVRTNPMEYLTFEDAQTYDKGIINTYTQLTGIKVTNRSPFSLRIEDASIEYDRGGTVVGTMPVTFKGAIPPGQTRTFSSAGGNLSSGTLEGKTDQYRMHVTRVDLIDVQLVAGQ